MFSFHIRQVKVKRSLQISHSIFQGMERFVIEQTSCLLDFIIVLLQPLLFVRRVRVAAIFSNKFWQICK